MLRGQSSLQQLLGKEQNWKRKKPAKQQPGSSKRAKPGPGAARASQLPVPTPVEGRQQEAGPEVAADGLSQCPVCQKQMPAAAVDEHLGKRLADHNLLPCRC